MFPANAFACRVWFNALGIICWATQGGVGYILGKVSIRSTQSISALKSLLWLSWNLIYMGHWWPYWCELPEISQPKVADFALGFFLSLNFWCREGGRKAGVGGLCLMWSTKELVNGSSSCSVSPKSLFSPSVIDEQGINCTLSYSMTLGTKRIFNLAFTVIIIALSELISELQV